MAKVGDIVFAKTHDVYTGEDTVSAAIVTRVYTGDDGEWAKDREILGLTVFGHNSAPTFIDMDKRSSDEFGSGSWSESSDDSAPAATPTNDTISTAPDTTPGNVGDGTPESVSGANTSTVGAPVGQPV